MSDTTQAAQALQDMCGVDQPGAVAAGCEQAIALPLRIGIAQQRHIVVRRVGQLGGLGEDLGGLLLHARHAESSAAWGQRLDQRGVVEEEGIAGPGGVADEGEAGQRMGRLRRRVISVNAPEQEV